MQKGQIVTVMIEGKKYKGTVNCTCNGGNTFRVVDKDDHNINSLYGFSRCCHTKDICKPTSVIGSRLSKAIK